MSVWKYALELTDLQDVVMPRGATVLHVAEQFGIPCIWALVDPDAVPERRRFAICGTGHPAPDSGYVGSLLMRGGNLVFHIFEAPA